MSVPLSRRALIAAACVEAAVRPPRQAVAQGLACEGIAAPPAVSLTAAEVERHRIYLLLTMSLVFAGWNVGPDQALRADYAARAPGRRFGPQLGHNIGAVLVEDDEVLCFALNRNIERRNTLAHAEARAVRHAFALGAGRLAANENRFAYSSLLRSATIYATLEPCSQCAGILDLANVPRMVFAQRDATQHCIGNILYNLHRDSGPAGAALPIRADFLRFAPALDAAYDAFRDRRAGRGPSGPTVFLESIEAYDIFAMAAEEFSTMRPDEAGNARALDAARAFHERWAPRVALGEALAP